jgi:hypothetical protein
MLTHWSSCTWTDCSDFKPIKISLKSHLSHALLYWYVTVWEIWGNSMSRCGRSEETSCHGVGDLRKLHVTVWEIWGNSMSRCGRSEETPCHGVGDLRKLHVTVWEIWGNSMSRCGISEETQLRVTCEWPYSMTIGLYLMINTIMTLLSPSNCS